LGMHEALTAFLHGEAATGACRTLHREEACRSMAQGFGRTCYAMLCSTAAQPDHQAFLPLNRLSNLILFLQKLNKGLASIQNQPKSYFCVVFYIGNVNMYKIIFTHK
jgi:hypothetical protein